MPKYNSDSTYTPFFYNNMFYKNIEAETFKILRMFKNKRLRLKVWKGLNVVCWKSVNTVQLHVLT